MVLLPHLTVTLSPVSMNQSEAAITGVTVGSFSSQQTEKGQAWGKQGAKADFASRRTHVWLVWSYLIARGRIVKWLDQCFPRTDFIYAKEYYGDQS